MKFNMFKKIALFSFFVAFSFKALASSYTQGVLDNGLKYHLFSSDSEEEYLEIHLLINVGGIDERPFEYGSAHMLEHTLFHKSKHFPEGISTALEKVGWKLGEQLNAYTGYEQTKFVMIPPLGVAEIDTALQALQDIVAAPDLAEDDWAHEQKIVLAERRNRLGLKVRMAEIRRQVLYRNAKQSQSTLIGTEQDILERKVSVLRAFHDRWYQPSNIQVAVVGNIKPTQVEKKLKQYLGSIKGKPVPNRGDDYYDPKLKNEWHITEIKDKQSKFNQVSLIFRINDGKNRKHDNEVGIRNQQIDRSARTMIMERLDAFNLALPKGVDPLFIQRSDIGHHSAAISLFAGTTAGQQQLGLEQLFEFRQQLLNYPISEKELKFYRDDMDAYIKANIDEDELPDDMQGLSRLALGVLRNRPAEPVGTKVKLYKKVMSGISVEDVNGRIKDWMMASDRSVMFQMEPEVNYQIPTREQLENMVLSYVQKSVAAPRDIEELVGGDFQFEQNPGTIIKKQLDPYYEKVHEWTLSNGDKFVWLNSSVAKDDAFFRSVADIGYFSKKFESWKARIASQFVWMSAPKGYNLQTLGTWRRRNSIVFRNNLTPENYYINGETGKENIEKVFQAYAAYHLTPKIDDDFMTMQLAGIRSSLIAQDDNSKKIRNAEEALRYQESHLNLPTPAQLDTINKEQLLTIWNQIIEAPVTHFLVADLPETQVESLVNQYLSGISRSSEQHSFYQEPLMSGKKKVELVVENTERTDIDTWAWGEQEWSTAASQQLHLARNLARNALKKELRGKEKGVYTVDFSSYINPKQQLISHLNFNATPENAENLWKVSQEVLNRLPEQLTQKIVDKEKKHLLRSEEKALKNPLVWLTRLTQSYEYYGNARILDEMLNINANMNFTGTQKMATKMWQKDNLRSLWVVPKEL